MILCLVSDRRRLAAAMGVDEEGSGGLLVHQVALAAAAGIDLIQIREPDLDARSLSTLVGECVRVITSTTTLLVNDRVDIALTAGAGGVHLKENSVSPGDVRRIAPPGFLISAAVHRAERVAARNGADLIVAGTVRPTASKPGVDYLDVDGLRDIVRTAEAPVLGIGGLDVDAAPLLVSAGAAGMAAVGAFIPGRGEDLTRFVQDRVKELRFAFDSVGRQP